MSAERVAHNVAGRLSLRQPQFDSLKKLHDAFQTVPALRDHQARSPEELKNMIEILAQQFPKLADFEREFPSLCFALATGVGKTRLMGAFISYLHLAYGYRHFFVLAPNLTIYNKLIQDFTPNTPKYVFKGIDAFAIAAPEVITGDNYDQRDRRTKSLDDAIEINIFNISKINSEVRGGKAPRIKRLSEYLGQSYFEYLAEQPDLILLMDESHRYRASAGIRALNELKPLIGLELTATPFTESTRGPVPFQNVVMDYPLARAIEDGFVKEPAVVTQQNFKPEEHSPEQLEDIKLRDGVRVHEETKVHLQTYSAQTGQKKVKPFMLVIARDTTHAAQLLAKIESDSFFNGQYRGKAIQVDSGTTSGAEGDAIIERLLAVESHDEPTEIVIHVNMLKEGWDVTNLYTIVPLRAANARTLIEQSIGRGLRLPFGRKTGVDVVDRLNIIAHDRFNEVVEEAGRSDSPIRLRELKLDPIDDSGQKIGSIKATTALDALLAGETATTGTGEPIATPATSTATPVTPPTPAFDAEERKIAIATKQVVTEIARDTTLVPNSAALQKPEVQAEIAKRVQERVVPMQGELLESKLTNPEAIAETVQKATEIIVAQTIDIPRILVKPRGAVTGHYEDFALDVSGLRFQPVDQKLIGQGLQSGKQVEYGQGSKPREDRFEDYIVRELIDFDDVSYDDHADLLYNLAGQAVVHFRSYLPEEDLHNVLGNYASQIAKVIHLQMVKHYREESAGYDVVVSQGFTPLKPCAFTAVGDVMTLVQTPEDKKKIAQCVYGGFDRCAYSHQKFDSDTERKLAFLLDQGPGVKLWFRPQGGQFNVFYRNGLYESEYVPDFVVSLDDQILMIETKKEKEVTEAQNAETEVKIKKDAAVLWCQRASDYAAQHGGKPWRYLLIPHDAVQPNVTLKALIDQFGA